jgi:hypothetical protein
MVSDSIKLAVKVRTFASKYCKTMTGSERRNTTLAVDICPRQRTRLSAALNTLTLSLLLSLVLCGQLPCLLFLLHEHIISCDFQRFWRCCIVINVALVPVHRLKLKKNKFPGECICVRLFHLRRRQIHPSERYGYCSLKPWTVSKISVTSVLYQTSSSAGQ